jgi:beta-glucosidase
MIGRIVMGVGIRTLLFVLVCAAVPATAGAQALRCGQFTTEPVAGPAPRTAESAVKRFEHIKDTVKTEPYRVLFLGDSITERFDPVVWQEQMKPRGVLNSGVNGDRTENLLWRLQHGNLDGPPPVGVVVLIGTNDLTNGGTGRPPEVAAEGIRANLLYLRARLPQTRIGLLGLWPRSVSPQAKLRRGTVAINKLIQSCGDDRWVAYADLGGVLLEPDGRLSPAIAPDALHFSEAGYRRLLPRLDPLVDWLLATR